MYVFQLPSSRLFYRFNCTGAEGDEDTTLSDAIPTTLRKEEVPFVAIRGMQRKINQIEETLLDKNDDVLAFLRSIVAEIEENREKVTLLLPLENFQCVSLWARKLCFFLEFGVASQWVVANKRVIVSLCGGEIPDVQIDVSQKTLTQLRLYLLGALALLATLLILNFAVITGSILTVVVASLLTIGFVYCNGELVENLLVLKPDSKGRNEDSSSESSGKFLTKSSFSKDICHIEQKPTGSKKWERALSIQHQQNKHHP